MKIIEYTKEKSRQDLTNEAFAVCKNANFPVLYEDVYNHLFAKNENIIRLVVDEQNVIKGFGVFEQYYSKIGEEILSMLYLSGMVIHKDFQGKNISQMIIKEVYQKVKTDLIALRTQNIKMATALLHLYPKSFLKMPQDSIKKEIVQTFLPFQNINQEGIIKDCYPNQLSTSISAINKLYNKKLEAKDALAVIIEPSYKKNFSLVQK